MPYKVTEEPEIGAAEAVLGIHAAAAVIVAALRMRRGLAMRRRAAAVRAEVFTDCVLFGISLSRECKRPPSHLRDSAGKLKAFREWTPKAVSPHYGSARLASNPLPGYI